MDLDNEPNVVVQKGKWHNRMYETYGLLCLSIYLYLIFHLDGMTTPNQEWNNLDSLFEV